MTVLDWDSQLFLPGRSFVEKWSAQFHCVAIALFSETLVHKQSECLKLPPNATHLLQSRYKCPHKVVTVEIHFERYPIESWFDPGRVDLEMSRTLLGYIWQDLTATDKCYSLCQMSRRATLLDNLRTRVWPKRSLMTLTVVNIFENPMLSFLEVYMVLWQPWGWKLVRCRPSPRSHYMSGTTLTQMAGNNQFTQ